MNRRNEIKKIWLECFDDPKDYVDMYFDRIYHDEDALTLEIGGNVVSSLLLQRYKMSFHGDIIPLAYIAGAATRRSYRGMGYMGNLMRRALQESYNRGDMICTLIPAHSWLYFYYDKLGFATVFYNDVQRFTSEHSFITDSHMLHETEDHFSDRVYDAFARLELEKQCCVLHSKRDFLNILDDLRMDGGRMIVMQDNNDEIRSLAFAVSSEELITVKALIADGELSASAALNTIRGYYPDKAFKVLANPDKYEHVHLSANGMGRIVNAKLCLESIAKSQNTWHTSIRISDPIIAANNRCFVVNHGKVTESRDVTDSSLDFDVNITTFTEMVFSSRKIGDILDFPTVRPVMSLMLD